MLNVITVFELKYNIRLINIQTTYLNCFTFYYQTNTSHHNLHGNTHVDADKWVGGIYAWFKFLWLHKKAQTFSNIAGFLLLRKMSSFFPSSVRPNDRNKTKSVYGSLTVHCRAETEKSTPSLTLWMLQPVAVHVVEVTTFKLLLTVVGYWHWDEWVHAVKPPLVSTTENRSVYQKSSSSHHVQTHNTVTNYIICLPSSSRRNSASFSFIIVMY